MSLAKRNYKNCEHEALAVIFALRKLRVYLLLWKPFVLITDQTFPYTVKKKMYTVDWKRAWVFLSECEFTFRYKTGANNKAADFFSRFGCSEYLLAGNDKKDDSSFFWWKRGFGVTIRYHSAVSY